jgi:hypothetical protein
MRARLSFVISGLALLATACGTPAIRSQPNAYSYLGKVVERVDDVDLAPAPAPLQPLGREWYLQMYGVAGAAMFDALESAKTQKTPSSPRTEYQRYTVLLEEQGEKVSLRSKVDSINVGDCVRVWIRGPGVSPVYLYAANQAELDKAAGCK